MTLEETARIMRIVGIGPRSVPWLWRPMCSRCGLELTVDAALSSASCKHSNALVNYKFSGPAIGTAGDHLYVGAMRAWLTGTADPRSGYPETRRERNAWECYLRRSLYSDTYGMGSTEAEATYNAALAAGLWKEDA